MRLMASIVLWDKTCRGAALRQHSVKWWCTGNAIWSPLRGNTTSLLIINCSPRRRPHNLIGSMTTITVTPLELIIVIIDMVMIDLSCPLESIDARNIGLINFVTSRRKCTVKPLCCLQELSEVFLSFTPHLLRGLADLANLVILRVVDDDCHGMAI